MPAGSDVSIRRQIREWASLRSGGSQNTHYVIPCGCDGHLWTQTLKISSRIHRWDALCHFMHDANTISRADTTDTSKNIGSTMNMTLRWEMLVLRKMVEVRTGFDRKPGGGLHKQPRLWSLMRLLTPISKANVLYLNISLFLSYAILDSIQS